MDIEGLVNWLKKHPVILVSSLVIVVISSIVTLVEGGGKIYGMYKATIGHNADLDKKLNSLNVGVDVGYFDSILGAPSIKNTRKIKIKYYPLDSMKDIDNPQGEEKEIVYKEYFYIDKNYYVQAVTNEIGKVGMYSVTARNENYIPEIKSDIGDLLHLGKSTYGDIKKKPRKVAGLLGVDMKHFNYYEVFLFDPGNYRYVVYSSNPNGYFEEVGSLDWEIGDVFTKWFSVDGNDFPMHKRHDEFRKRTTINTYSVTAPWFHGIDLTDNGVNYGGAKINFGPHVDEVGIIK